jgi:hypothetical protein
MPSPPRPCLPGLLLALLLAIASAAPGWLHAAPAPPDAAFAAFLAAGGAAQDICAGTPSHEAHPDHDDCTLCRLGGAVGIAPASVLQETHPLPGLALALTASDIDHGHLRRHPAWSGRAPPFG